MSDKYLDYLNQHIEIAPANSEEEVQAAQLIQKVLESDGLEVEVQDFDAPNDTQFVVGVMFAVLFFGMVIAGIGGAAFAVLGFVIVAVSFALLALRYTGNDIVARMMPPARSQNVIGLHRGTGPHSGRGVRPIVIMAHYDTGHEEPLANPSVARYSKYVYLAAPYGTAVAFVCALLQMFVVIPAPGLRLIWFVGILAALPGLVWGANNIAAHFMPLTGAANDNNASIAAMMGVVEDVSTVDPAKRAERAAQLEAAAAAAAAANDEEYEPGAYAEQPEERYEEVQEVTVEPVEGVRHGKAVIEALGILPATCTVTYLEPQRTVTTRRVAVEAPAPEPHAEGKLAIELQEPEAPVEPEAPAAVSETASMPVPADLEPAEEPAPAFADKPADEPEAAPAEEPAFEAPRLAEPVEPQGVAEDEGLSTVGEPTPRSARHDEESEALNEQFRSVSRLMDDRVTWADTPVPVSDIEAPDEEAAQIEAARAEDAQAARDARTVRLVDDEAVADVVEADEVASADETAQVQAATADEADSTAAVEPASGSTQAMPATTDDSGATQAMPVQQAPAAAPSVSDPSWGQSNFQPSQRNIARRASLFDLPDPSVSDGDPLASNARRRPTLSADTFDGRAQAAAAPAEHAVAPQPVVPEDHRPKKQSLRERFHLGRSQEGQDSMSEWLGVDDDFDAKTDGERIGSWSNFDDGKGSWKGGAARSADHDDRAEDADEMVDALLDMDYVDLVAHDIWFVATGASELGHAGAKAFLDAHKKDLRGAFLVNLSCVGAGDLTLLTEEGFGAKRRVDRRLLKMIDRIARDLHVPLQEEPRGWRDTDATVAMRRSVRSATLMGCDVGPVPALSHTAENVPENVDGAQVLNVSRIVSELIRRA